MDSPALAAVYAPVRAPAGSRRRRQSLRPARRCPPLVRVPATIAARGAAVVQRLADREVPAVATGAPIRCGHRTGEVITMERFEGKRAIITGAASGLGRATVARLVSDGAVVFGVDRSAEGLAATSAALATDADRFIAHVADVSDEPAVIAAVQQAVARLGGVDVLPTWPAFSARRRSPASPRPTCWNCFRSHSRHAVLLPRGRPASARQHRRDCERRADRRLEGPPVHVRARGEQRGGARAVPNPCRRQQPSKP